MLIILTVINMNRWLSSRFLNTVHNKRGKRKDTTFALAKIASL